MHLPFPLQFDGQEVKMDKEERRGLGPRRRSEKERKAEGRRRKVDESSIDGFSI